MIVSLRESEEAIVSLRESEEAIGTIRESEEVIEAIAFENPKKFCSLVHGISRFTDCARSPHPGVGAMG